ncbi:MAG: baseplate J/gp47 family protein [Gammaproteobacteria bacterium]|nr:baseplate J/gp47 family protein [Gammaproteobacteria bacterium]
MPTIDISTLPAPEIVEQKDYDTILAEMLADLQSRDPELDINVTDPSYRTLEVSAYREFLLRQEFNDRARAMLLAFASGSDMDHIGVTYYQLERLVITPGDPSAVPPVDPVYESDEAYLERLLLSEQGQSVAGPVGSYKFLSMSADGQVKDTKPLAHTPNPGDITIVILSHTGDGTADQALQDIVDAALSDEDVRPMNDTPIVQSATILDYTINATLALFPGADEATTLQSANDSAQSFVDSQHMIGRTITLDGVLGALRVSGVSKVTLNNTVGTDITAEKAVSDTEAAYCSGITIAMGGYDE